VYFYVFIYPFHLSILGIILFIYGKMIFSFLAMISYSIFLKFSGFLADFSASAHNNILSIKITKLL